MCRPESLALTPPGEGTIRGRVVTSMYLGDTLEVYVSTYDGEVLVQISNPAGKRRYDAGEAVGVLIPAEGAKALAEEE